MNRNARGTWTWITQRIGPNGNTFFLDYLFGYSYGSRFRLLGCGCGIVGRVPVGLGREMEDIGMVASPCAERLFVQTVFVQILLFMVGFLSNFINFVGGGWQMAIFIDSVLFDADYKGTLVI